MSETPILGYEERLKRVHTAIQRAPTDPKILEQQISELISEGEKLSIKPGRIVDIINEIEARYRWIRLLRSRANQLNAQQTKDNKFIEFKIA